MPKSFINTGLAYHREQAAALFDAQKTMFPFCSDWQVVHEGGNAHFRMPFQVFDPLRPLCKLDLVITSLASRPEAATDVVLTWRPQAGGPVFLLGKAVWKAYGFHHKLMTGKGLKTELGSSNSWYMGINENRSLPDHKYFNQMDWLAREMLPIPEDFSALMLRCEKFFLIEGLSTVRSPWSSLVLREF